MYKIVARPAVKRVNRVIKVPKAVTTILPKVDSKSFKQAVVSALPKRAISGNRSQQPKSILIGAERKLSVSKLPVTKVRSNPLAKPAKSKGVKVSYVSKEVTSQDLKKVTELRGVGRGRFLIIVGNGPSVNEIDLRALAQHPLIDIMSINKPVSYIWPTKYWLFCDQTQYTRHEGLWADYQGVIFNTTSIKHRKQNSMQIKNIGNFGFSTDLTKGFHVGRSSVYAGMQVAAHMEYDHTYIVGCDMSLVNGAAHFFGSNPDVSPENRASRFDNEARHYDFAANMLSAAIREKYTFCSGYNRYNFVDKFNRMNHVGAVELILSRAG